MFKRNITHYHFKGHNKNNSLILEFNNKVNSNAKKHKIFVSIQNGLYNIDNLFINYFGNKTIEYDTLKELKYNINNFNNYYNIDLFPYYLYSTHYTYKKETENYHIFRIHPDKWRGRILDSQNQKVIGLFSQIYKTRKEVLENLDYIVKTNKIKILEKDSHLDQ